MTKRIPKFDDSKYNDLSQGYFPFTSSPRSTMQKQRLSLNSNIKIPRLKLHNSEKCFDIDLKITGNKTTRDISYLKDKLMDPRKSMTPSILPTDLETIKKLLRTSDPLGIPTSVSPRGISSPTSCQKNICLEILTRNSAKTIDPEKSVEMLERHYLGSPTGRQDIKSLKE